MRRERVSENIYVFFSEEYAEVTSGAILTRDGLILIDTLPFPHETREMRSLLESRGAGPVRYVINTHFHSDHVYGNYLFPEAEVVAQEGCRAELQERGEAGLIQDKMHNPALAEVELRLPTITFEQEMALYLGGVSLRLMHRPGHTADSSIAYLEQERVLFAGDTIMRLPYIAWGDWRALVASLRAVRELRGDTIIQGHGEIILRGETQDTLSRHIFYLEDVHRRVKELVLAGASARELEQIGLEDYEPEPRLVLGGLGQELHRANLLRLYESLKAGEPPSP